MEKTLNLAISLVALVAVHLSFAVKPSNAQPLPAACPNANARFLTGPEFLDNGSMTLDGIRNYLRAIGSWLQGDANGMVLDTDNVMFDFAKAVFDAAADPIALPGVSKMPINPQLLLAMIEKEQTMLFQRKRPIRLAPRALTLLTGCGAASTMRGQIQCAARTLRNRFDELAACGDTPNDPAWNLIGLKRQPGIPIPSRDGVNVTPTNASTVAHYPYNPLAGKQWGGQTKYGGVARFCILWHTPDNEGGTGFANPPTSLTLAPEVLNATLTCSDPLVPDPKLTNRTVTYRHLILSVSGGTPGPNGYTWTPTWPTSTEGTLTTCGANGEDAVLKPPVNKGGFTGDTAYLQLVRQGSDCTTPGGRNYWKASYDCNDQLLSTPMCGEVSWSFPCREGPCNNLSGTQQCPNAALGTTCSTYTCHEGDSPPSVVMACVVGVGNCSGSSICDKRTMLMVNNSCNPCVGVMSGASVKVSDGVTEITRPITVR